MLPHRLHGDGIGIGWSARVSATLWPWYRPVTGLRARVNMSPLFRVLDVKLWQIVVQAIQQFVNMHDVFYVLVGEVS